MSLFESFLTAIDSLRANKMRTLLTMLGVIIGVGAVITMIGIAQGARQATLEQVQRLGANVLTVRPGQARRGGAFLGVGLDDAEPSGWDAPQAEQSSAPALQPSAPAPQLPSTRAATLLPARMETPYEPQPAPWMHPAPEEPPYSREEAAHEARVPTAQPRTAFRWLH